MHGGGQRTTCREAAYKSGNLCIINSRKHIRVYKYEIGIWLSPLSAHRAWRGEGGVWTGSNSKVRHFSPAEKVLALGPDELETAGTKEC